MRMQKAEAFSAKAVIEGFHSDEIFYKLEELMNELFARRADRLPIIPSSTFRLPTRVTLNDARRRAWFRDLANPDVPLHKLGKSVPHGAKGHDLLDLLHTNNVAIPRAVWFLRVFGANEVAGLRNKPTYNPAQYSIDWANVVSGYMKKQLLEIALPSPPRAGLNIKQTFKGVLTDNETRERWISRFSYCLQLLRSFYAEGLVDKRTFLVWLVQQMSACNLAQTGFIARLADEYLAEIVETRALSHSFIDACLNRLYEIRSSGPAQACLINTDVLLRTLVQQVCLSTIDGFISPRMWNSYSTLICDALTGEVLRHPGYQHIEQSKMTIQTELLDHLTTIKARNEAMLLHGLPAQVPALLGSAVSDVKLLNSISDKTNLEEITFFDCDVDNVETFARKIDILFTWSVTSLQYGYHRPFVAVSLLGMWQAKLSERAHRRNLMSPHDFLQDRLFDWLDLSRAAYAEENLNAVALLYENLIGRGLFCYATYIQRLIARGESGLSLTEMNGSRHRIFIRYIPLLDSDPSLVSQRKALLYGVRAREVPEEMNERQIRKEIRIILPGLFRGNNKCSDPPLPTLASSCTTFITSPRFEQVRILRQWLLPILQNYATDQQADSDPSTFLQVYSLSVEMMALAKCFDCMMDLIISVLKNVISTEVAMAIVDHLYRYADIWQCIGCLGNLVLELDAADQALKARGHQSRLPFDLLQLDGGRYLSPVSHDRINSDIVHFTLALQPVASHPEYVPDVLPEIFLLEKGTDPDFPSRLANSLWIKYRTSPEWGWKVWDNALASLQNIADGELTVEARHKYALSYGTFLWHIDQHLATGLDGDVLHWLTGPGQSQMPNFSPQMWDILSIILVYLVAYRALRITTIMSGLVFPAWQQGASLEDEEPDPEGYIVKYVQAASKVCGILLLHQNHSDDLLPLEINRTQCLESRQQTVYSEPFFLTFITKIPVLIQLENNAHLSQEIRLQIGGLRQKLCQEEAFRRGAYRNLDGTREAFEHSFIFSESKGDLGKNLIAGLRHVLSNTDGDATPGQWLPSAHQFFSPWKLAATSIHLQLILKELGRALSHEATKEHATLSLDKVSQELFDRRITHEEAYYIGEITRGADDAVVGKLISSGLRRIVEILVNPTGSEDGLINDLYWANEVLRAILYMAGPSEDEVVSIPGLDSSLHELLVSAVRKKLDVIGQAISSEYNCDAIIPAIVILLRLLQFTLGFRGTWSVKAKDDGILISSSLFHFALKMSAGSDVEVSIYPLLLDTLYYLLDEIPCDSRAAFDPFRNYPEFVTPDIPTNIAPEHRKQILALSAQVSPNALVSELVMSDRKDGNGAILGNPVINCPWEWMEYLGEPVVPDAKERRNSEEIGNLKHAFKNAGSISLELFGAKVTGDCIPTTTEELDGKMESHVRAFEDGLSVNNLFKRDWQEARVKINEDPSLLAVSKQVAEHESSAGNEIVTSGHANKNQLMTTSCRSPSHASHTSVSSELADLESNTTISSKMLSASKRKIGSLSDDEMEAAEGSMHAMVTSVMKKGKHKAGSKGKGKRR
ncbi:hypothetical protein AX15_007713 [Amanita polypyramis BW_CC]|nr:hypothetical protein AX15_007713 [Amanita polypyramis BW_CC]